MSIIIKKQPSKLVPLGDLEIGDTFCFDGRYFIKYSEGRNQQCIPLDEVFQYSMQTFGETAPVRPVDLEIREV